MISILTGLAYVGVLVVTGRHLRFLLYALAIMLVSMSSRVMSVVYLDVAGPEYSVQLFRHLGPGNATLPLVLAHLVLLAAFLVVFTPSVSRGLAGRCDAAHQIGATRQDRLISNCVFASFVAFTVLLVADFVRIGVVPLIVGLERWEYTQSYGGIWHQSLMEYGVLLALVLGLFYSNGLLQSARADNRFLYILIVLFGYLYLAGHRFSAFYTYTSAFLLPYSVVVLWSDFSPRAAMFTRRTRRAWSRVLQLGAAIFAVALIALALYNSYFVTRDLGQRDPAELLTHRVLVQPGELWYATFERVFVDGINQPAEAFDSVFLKTIIDSNRNSTIPYLMVAEIGEAAYPTLDAGLGYGGGYPEIFFELLGPFWAYPALFAYGLITASLFFVLLGAIAEKRYLRVALCWYVLFAFVNASLGGMLNFLVNWKFWLKVGALLGWILVERVGQRLGRAELVSVRT